MFLSLTLNHEIIGPKVLVMILIFNTYLFVRQKLGIDGNWNVFLLIIVVRNVIFNMLTVMFFFLNCQLQNVLLVFIDIYLMTCLLRVNYETFHS